MMFTLFFYAAVITHAVARSAGRRAWHLAAVALLAGFSVPAIGQVISYEGNVFPEAAGWLPLSFTLQRSIEDGRLVQTVENGQEDLYRFNIGGINGLVGRFFVEWRAVTDNPSWLIDELKVPAVVAAGGHAASLYHTVMTESAAVLLRDVSIPRVIAPISVDTPHVYRVEVFPDEYIWYIDGIVADSGIPEGPYPDADAAVVWGVEGNEGITATTAWDFVRLGRIPDDASGDFDSDAAVTLFDLYYFDDCLTKDGPGIFGGPGENAGPGCRFADFDADGDVDLFDFADFQNAFSGPHP